MYLDETMEQARFYFTELRLKLGKIKPKIKLKEKIAPTI